MEWRDDGLIIGGKRHGETSLILEVMTRHHGRHLGIVKGGRSKRMQPLLQPGNSVEVTWRARLDEHLGFFAVEATTLRAAAMMADPEALQGLNLMGALLRLLAEREPHEALFALALDLIGRLGEAGTARHDLVRFELAVLADCGFGIDLDQCAVTGRRDDLIWVSPKSGRAVSREAGEPYKDRLLRLPAFLVEDEAPDPAVTDLSDGFALAGFFLSRDLFAPRGLALPEAHAAFVALMLKTKRD